MALLFRNWPFSPPKPRTLLPVTLFTHESFFWLASTHGWTEGYFSNKMIHGKGVTCLANKMIHTYLFADDSCPCWLIHQRFSTTQQTYCCTYYYCKLVLGFRVHPSPLPIFPKWIFCTFWWIINLGPSSSEAPLDPIWCSCVKVWWISYTTGKAIRWTDRHISVNIQSDRACAYQLNEGQIQPTPTNAPSTGWMPVMTPSCG